MLTFAFAFCDFEKLPWNFGLACTGSKLENFRLGDGESWKNQYSSNLLKIYGFPKLLENHRSKKGHSGHMVSVDSADSADSEDFWGFPKETGSFSP